MNNENYNGLEPPHLQAKHLGQAPVARTESMESLEKQDVSKQNEDPGIVKLSRDVTNNGELTVDLGTPEVAFAGMGREELMKYANDPFWVRLRWILFVLFWVGWLAMLVGAIIIVVMAPKCPPLKYWQKGAVYEVFPKSFQDGGQKQDGVGDIKGIFCDS